ncbi:DUF4129 domain-containing protein [Maricaulis sp. W15]|uniref:DUF4129 domain-containing protein n=1 Tax=Maricaulis sp. W15 TaxID=1772333 RepID=UPI0009FB509F|nr:DUF4129 domain-containing protein [Maricaulis sp. W15]
MASSPRPDTASRTASRLRSWLWLLAVIGLTVLVMWTWQTLAGPSTEGAAALTGDYADLARSRGLQVELDYLDAEADWRALADLPDPSDDIGMSFPWLAGLTMVMVIKWVVIGLAVGVLAYIVYLAIRHGAGLRVATRQVAAVGDHDGPGKGGLPAGELPLLSLEEIARLADAAKALGALQRLVLVAAAEATGSVLRRSETAREALRRLPRDWGHYDKVARLVQIAEQVRYAGRPIEQDGLDGLIADARLVLGAGAAVS